MTLNVKTKLAGLVLSTLCITACGNQQESKLSSISESWTRGELEFVRVSAIGPSNTNVISVSIPRPDPTWRVVSGGGKVNYGGPGMLLTASYPVGSDGAEWRVEAKAHLYGDTGNIEGSAIFVRKKGGARISDSDYLIAERVSGQSLLPVANSPLSTGFTLVGGGAFLRDNLPGGGQLLTASYPEGNSWVAMSKAHDVGVYKTLHSYAIGLKSSFLAESRIEVSWQSSELIGNEPRTECNSANGFDLIGGGAHVVDGQSAPGLLLTASYPKGQNTWAAAAKAHKYNDQKNLKVYCIGVKDL